MTGIYPYKHILVTVDGSKVISNVLESAVDSALRNHASLDILRIVQVAQLIDSYSNAALNNEETYNIAKTAKERLDGLKKRAVDAGVEDVNVHTRFGDLKRVIVHGFPSDHNTDLIALGATGVSDLKRFVLGSVTHYVS